MSTKRIICPACKKHNVQVFKYDQIAKHRAPAQQSEWNDRTGYCVMSNTTLQPPRELVRGIF